MPDAKSGLDHASTYVPSWYSLNWKKVPSNAKISVIEHNTINMFLWNQIEKDYSTPSRKNINYIGVIFIIILWRHNYKESVFMKVYL